MEQNRSIAINGDLGSGKSTVSIQLAERLGVRRVSVGDMYREIAKKRGMTALELNLHSQIDEEVDAQVDGLQREIATSGEKLVVDSRLAWHFLKDALRVHLIVDPTVAVERVLSRPSSEVESYGSADEALRDLEERNRSERERFIARYGVDKSRLRNYDLIVDSSLLAPGEVTQRIIDVMSGRLGAEVLARSHPFMLLNPARIYPSEQIKELRGLWESEFVEIIDREGIRNMEPISIGYTGSSFYVIDGHRRLSAALQNHWPCIPARLLAEFEEHVAGGLDATSYFEAAVGLSMIYDWEAAHKVALSLPPHLQMEP